MTRALLLLLLGASACDCGADDDPDLEAFPDGQPALREVVIRGALPETGEDGLIPGDDATLRDVLERVRQAGRSDYAKGLFLRLGPQGGAWGAMADLADALSGVRQAGKPVHCHVEAADNVSFALLSRSCDRLTMTPAGHLELVGVSAHVLHARDLFEKVGVRPELMQEGRFKGAADLFTRQEMSPEVEQSTRQLVDDLQAMLVEAIAEGRKLPTARVQALIDEGPFTAHAARQAGLIDDAEFDDEAREHARIAATAERVRRVSLTPPRKPIGLSDLLGALAGDVPDTQPEGPRIAIVYLTGTIVDGDEDGGSPTQAGPFVRTLRRLADDDDVKAIVLRVSSPGGSALGSDRMWHAVRRAAAKKPVIASVGGMAASGAYYTASAATEILAQPGSLIGSIGVVGGKFSVDQLAGRIGVAAAILEGGENAAWTSPLRSFDEGERRILRRLLHNTYSRFLRRVATGRKMTPEALTPVAEGRLMTAPRAKSGGLIDDLAGFAEAQDRARTAGGLPADAPAEQWPRRRTLLEALAEGMGGGGGRGESDAETRAIVQLAGGHSQSLVGLWQVLRNERVAAILPWGLRVE